MNQKKISRLIQNYQKAETIKIRADINEIENRKTIESTKPKVGSLKRSMKLTNLQLNGLRKKKQDSNC